MSFPKELPGFVLAGVAQHRQAYVRGAAAKHPNCPDDIRAHLCSDPDPMVRSRAWGATHDMQRLVQALNEGVDEAAVAGTAANPRSTTAMLQLVLSRRPPAPVIARVVAHRNCPPEALARYSFGRNKTILRGAVANPNCSTDALAHILTLGDGVLADMVARHPNCSPALLEHIATHDWGNNWDAWWHTVERPDCPPEAVRALVEVDKAVVRGAALEHPNCPPDVLESFSQRGLTYRLSVVQNPNCPPTILMRMARDEDVVLRQRALKHPNCPEEYRALARVAR
jgi:hypothetical protein